MHILSTYTLRLLGGGVKQKMQTNVIPPLMLHCKQFLFVNFSCHVLNTNYLLHPIVKKDDNIMFRLFTDYNLPINKIVRLIQ